MNPPAEFYLIVRQFVEKFFGSYKINSSVQRKWKTLSEGKSPIGYYPLKRPITNQDIAEHFYITPLDRGVFIQGALGVVPPIIEGKLRFVCIDIDSPDLFKEVENILFPYLNKLHIPYIKELGGDNLDRCHIWFLTNLTPALAKAVFNNLLEGSGIPLQKFSEVFGINKPTNLIRLPGGAHLFREGKRFPIEFGYEHITDPIQIMKMFINTTIIDEDYIKSQKLDHLLIVPEVKRTTSSRKRAQKFIYQSLELPIPEETPSTIIPLAKECKAINDTIRLVKDETREELLGEEYHWGSLQLQRLAKIHDIKTKTTEGMKWWEDITSNFKWKKEHNWKSKQEEISKTPYRFIAPCDKWDSKYPSCQKCPYRGVITSPAIFLNSSGIARELIETKKLLTPEEVKEQTFKQFSENLLQYVREGTEKNMLLASPQGSGKSSLLSKVAAQIGKMGKRVLIAVPTAKVAMEHKERIEREGIRPFILMSHKNIFTHLAKDYECPEYDNIQALARLGVGSSTYRSQYCDGCPLFDKCHYPNQYSQVMEDKYNVVIIQHAHLQCQEIVWELAKKHFDVLFIDESFIKSCFTFIKPSKEELDLLDTKDCKWSKELSDWLKGRDNPRGYMYPPEEDLRILRNDFLEEGVQWTIPDYIRYYNQRRTVNILSGIEIIYELPNIPILVLTDATPPEELIKTLTGIESIEVYGKSEVLDVTKIHPDNQIIQILDSSSSVTDLEREENFEDILFKIGELCEITYHDKKILFTIYKRHYEKIIEFFRNHPAEFPSIMDRLVDDKNPKDIPNPIYLDWMDKGTNEFADFDIQFLMAGVYYRGDQYLLDTYKYKSVLNYFNLKKGKERILNIYPYEQDPSMSIEREKEPITRIEIVEGVPGVYQYPDFNSYPPKDNWYRLIYELNIANTQQAIRLRFIPNKPRTVFILNNFYLPTTVITKSILFKEFIKPL